TWRRELRSVGEPLDSDADDERAGASLLRVGRLDRERRDRVGWHQGGTRCGQGQRPRERRSVSAMSAQIAPRALALASLVACTVRADPGIELPSATGTEIDPPAPPAPDLAPCVGDAIEQRSCGRCGVQERICHDGTWTDFGYCGYEGECAV